MRGKLRIGAEIWLGCAEQRMKRLEEIRNLEHDQSLLESLKSSSILTVEGFDRFRSIQSYIKDSTKKEFSKVNQRAQAIVAYLAAHTAQELNEQIQLSWETKVPGLHHHFHRDSLPVDIKNACEQAVKNSEPEERLKDRIKDIALRNRDGFLYSQALFQITTEADSLHKSNAGASDNEYWMTKNYLPEPLDAMPPLDNRDKKNWILNLSDGQQLPFERPAWFGRYNKATDEIEGTHDGLSMLTTAIVSISALRESWLRTTHPVTLSAG